MAYQAGTAFVQVLPSVRGWNAKIRAEIKSSFPNGLQIDVTPKFDAGKIRAEIKSTFPNGLTIDVTPKFDAGTVRAQAATTAKSAGQTVKFKAEFDLGAIRNSITNLATFARALKTVAPPSRWWRSPPRP